MRDAYYGFLNYAIGREELVQEFRAATGNTWTLGKTPIDRAIDKALGRDIEFFQSFSDWLEKTYWGTPKDLKRDTGNTKE